MTYVTTADRIIVKPDNSDGKTKSGFIMAYDDEPTKVGTVVLIGPGRVTKKNVIIPVDLVVGDRVMYFKDTGIPVKVDGESMLIFKEDEIIGTVEQTS